jgi:hypothetical protein
LGYLRRQRARAYLNGDYPYYPSPPLALLEQVLQPVHRAYASVVASGVAEVDQSIVYARFESGDAFQSVRNVLRCRKASTRGLCSWSLYRCINGCITAMTKHVFAQIANVQADIVTRDWYPGA